MIYFVSDIHLGGGSAEQQRRTEEAFCRWLDMIAPDVTSLYLLGDIFDFWFEYHRVVPAGFVRVLSRLSEFSRRGVEVVLYTGNHDMWCYDYLTRECGIRIERNPRVEHIGGRIVHLAHGDNMNVKGQPMLRLMNLFFRSSVARCLFSWLVHPDLALKFGCWWSGKSRKSHGAVALSLTHLTPLKEYASEHKLSHTNVEAYIFGHMHIPHHEKMEEYEMFFLSDWSAEEAVYVAMDSDNMLSLKTFAIDETIS